MKISISLMLMLFTFGAIHASNDYLMQNYVYDNEGNPLFVKVYLQKNLSSNRHPFVNSMIQDDHRGSFLAVPLKKKKSNDDDDDKDESTWECPYCGAINPASRNTCQTKGCVLHR